MILGNRSFGLRQRYGKIGKLPMIQAPQAALLALRLKREEWRQVSARCMGGIHSVVASRGCKFHCYLAPSENGRIEMEAPPNTARPRPSTSPSPGCRECMGGNYLV